MVKPVLSGRPHPPTSEQKVIEAREVYELLRHEEVPEKGMQWAIAVLGNAAFTPAIPLIEHALRDENPYVRALALQTLTLDFHLPEHCQTAWSMLNDEHYEPRRIAAGSLGFCYWATRDITVLKPLIDLVRRDDEDWLVRQTAYNSIFDLLGYPILHPKRPPTNRQLDFAAEVDWSLLNSLERGELPPVPEES